MGSHSSTQTEKFVCDENIRRYERELRTVTEPVRRATLLHLLVEEENKLGRNREQLTLTELRIADANRSIENQIALIKRMTDEDLDTTAATAMLVTFRQTLALYRWHHDRIVEKLNGGAGATPLEYDRHGL